MTATANPSYNPAIGGNTPPVTIDGTGLTTTIPLTIKNAKAESGIELWYTGTVATGYDLMNASGVLKGGIAIAAAAGDWTTSSAADDIIIHAGATKAIRIGAKGSAAMVVFDLNTSTATFGASQKLAFDSNNSLTSCALQVAGDANTGLVQKNGADTLSLVCGAVETGQFSATAAVFASSTITITSGVLTIKDPANFVFGTSTGTKFGTVGGAAGQKLAFWNSTPIVQPLLATGAAATVDNVITVLQNLGLCRQS